MNTSRLQHLVPAAAVLALASIVTYLSFTQQPAESFLFPRIVSVAFIGLAVWNFVRAAAGMAKVGGGLSRNEMINIAPGLIVALLFGFFAAKNLGFYVASTIAFFAVYSIYDPVPLSSVRDWVKRAVVTIIFMGVIYGLFAMLLKVQTPKGLFF